MNQRQCLTCHDDPCPHASCRKKWERQAAGSGWRPHFQARVAADQEWRAEPVASAALTKLCLARQMALRIAHAPGPKRCACLGIACRLPILSTPGHVTGLGTELTQTRALTRARECTHKHARCRMARPHRPWSNLCRCLHHARLSCTSVFRKACTTPHPRARAASGRGALDWERHAGVRLLEAAR